MKKAAPFGAAFFLTPAASRSGKWAVLEVILQNPRRQRGGHGFSSTLNPAHDFSAAYHFRGRESGDFRGEHEIDFQLSAGLQGFVGLEEHARTADIFGCAHVPVILAESAITQRQVKVESLCAVGRVFSGPCGAEWFSGLHRHDDLRGSWICIEHFADYALQVAKVKRLLEQAYAGIQRAVVSDHIFGVAGHVEHFYVGAN